MKRILSFLFCLSVLTCLSAQIVEPIRWNARTVMEGDNKGYVQLSAQVEDGWHLYNLTLPDGGRIQRKSSLKLLRASNLPVKSSRRQHRS